MQIRTHRFGSWDWSKPTRRAIGWEVPEAVDQCSSSASRRGTWRPQLFMLASLYEFTDQTGRGVSCAGPNSGPTSGHLCARLCYCASLRRAGPPGGRPLLAGLKF